MFERRAYSRGYENMSRRELLIVSFYQRFSGLLVDFYNGYADVRLRTADYAYTDIRRLPYSRFKMWVEEDRSFISIDHPEEGVLLVPLDGRDIPNGLYDNALRLVQVGSMRSQSREPMATRRIRF